MPTVMRCPRKHVLTRDREFENDLTCDVRECKRTIFAGTECFEEFALTDDVSPELCWDCEDAPVKPLGWLAFAMLGYAIVALVLFNVWASHALGAATRAKADGAILGSNGAPMV